MSSGKGNARDRRRLRILYLCLYVRNRRRFHACHMDERRAGSLCLKTTSALGRESMFPRDIVDTSIWFVVV